MKVQLKLFHQLIEVTRMECDYILGDAIGFSSCVAMDSLENTHSSSGESIEALPNVVRVALGAVLEEHLPWLRGTGKILQLAQFVSAPSS